jgi:diaminopimelate decarboxylase
MTFFYQDGFLFCEELKVVDIQQRVKLSPFYLYSAGQIKSNFNKYVSALDGISSEISYAIKANGNLSILKLLRSLGSRVTLVSGNELRLALTAGFDPGCMIFNGNGKTIPELRLAVDQGVFINIDSLFDLEHINRVSQELGKTVDVLLRINPEIDAKVHPFVSTGLRTSKFGLSNENLPGVMDKMTGMPQLNLVGVHCHLGSTIDQVNVFRQTMIIMVRHFEMIRQRGFPLKYLNIGGGLGIDYQRQGGSFPTPSDLVDSLRDLLPQDATLILEPGRSLVGNAGIFICRVIGVKRGSENNFIVTDGSMAELIRPSLYQAYHEIGFTEPFDSEHRVWHIVGPVCESADYLGKYRMLPSPQEGAGVAIFDTGAYGFVMSSNYNARLRPAEYLVDGDQLTQIRRAESFEDFLRFFETSER